MDDIDAIRGAELVRSTGIYQQNKLGDCLDVIAWLDVNRAHADKHGCCPGGCDRELVQHETRGHAVCPLTYDYCQQRRLSLLVQQFGVINGKKRTDPV
jgi:hypothetical protein